MFSFETENWHPTRAEVSRISITTLMERCEFILSRFLIDENNVGMDLHFPMNLNMFYACDSVICGFLWQALVQSQLLDLKRLSLSFKNLSASPFTQSLLRFFNCDPLWKPYYKKITVTPVHTYLSFSPRCARLCYQGNITSSSRNTP